MSIEHLLCATVPKIAFVIVLKDACLKEISCNCNHTEIGVSLVIENETRNRHMKKDIFFPTVSLQSCPDYALIMPLEA